MSQQNFDKQLDKIKKVIAKLERTNKSNKKDPDISTINDMWGQSKDLSNQALKLADLSEDLELLYFPM